jgi:hypothetical protein
LGGEVSPNALKLALANAYGIETDEVNLQYQDKFDLSAPERRLFCLVNKSDGGEFPALLTLSSCETDSNDDNLAIASKISQSLGVICLISSGRLYDDDTKRLVNGFEEPRLVLVREEYDEVLEQSVYYIDGDV